MTAETTPPRLQATAITIATARTHEMAQFYARLLGLPVTADDPGTPGDPVDGGWAQVKAPDGTGLTLNFEYERHYTPPTWPTTPESQNPTQHLDIRVDDLEAGVRWAVECGATLADFQPQDDVRVLFDVDGHPFCLFLQSG